MDLKELQQNDPLKRIAEKDSGKQGLSPMEPPEAYDLPVKSDIPYEDYHPLLQKLFDDHKKSKAELKTFEDVLEKLRKDGPGSALQGLSDFFRFLDEKILVHNQNEEKFLFPVLQKRLLELGDHSNGPAKTTAVDMLEDDHVKLLQVAAVTFNLIGLASRLPEEKSRIVALDAGIEQGIAMVEMLRLHVFREENVVFPKAQECLTISELDQLKIEFDQSLQR